MRVGIVGANGYSGIELIRLILQHPFATLNLIVSHSNNGRKITDLYPHLSDIYEEELETLDLEDVKNKVDLIFLATPSGVSKDLAPLILEKGIKCIDLSGDFRLHSSIDYEKWYQFSHPNEPYLMIAAYGLTEIFEHEIKNTNLVANPGCYPTAALLGIIPCVVNDLISTDSIVIDGKSGVSGAGRKMSLSSHFSETNENVKAYKLGKHQHIPEIEQTLYKVTKKPIHTTFTTHLIPMTRGLMCTIYTDLNTDTTTESVIEMYENFYKHSSFVRIRPKGDIPTTKQVSGSNYCDIGLYVDERTRKLVIISVIDNVVKGAAGQAIQNMNIMNDWDMETGLLLSPVYP